MFYSIFGVLAEWEEGGGPSPGDARKHMNEINVMVKLQMDCRRGRRGGVSPRDLRNQMNECSLMVEFQMGCRKGEGGLPRELPRPNE